MNSYRFKTPDSVLHFLRSLPPSTKSKIRAGLDHILKNPQEGKPLKAELLGLRSFRVGHFRIVYKVLKNTIDIVLIGPRETIYTDVEKLI